MSVKGSADRDSCRGSQLTLNVAAVPDGYRVCMAATFEIRGLPGAELVSKGISDLEQCIVSSEALLVSIGAPRLRGLGIDLPRTLDDPERRLYELLRDQFGDAAHSRYNALVRRLVSFERAAASVARA